MTVTAPAPTNTPSGQQAASAADVIAVQIRAGTVLSPDPVGVKISAPAWSAPVALRNKQLRGLILQLHDAPAGTADLVAKAGREGGLGTAIELQMLLAKLSGVGVLDHVLLSHGRVRARLTGEGTLPVRLPDRVAPAPKGRRLSAHTVMTVQGDWIRLQTGLGHQHVLLTAEDLPSVLRGRWDELPVSLGAMFVHARLLDPDQPVPALRRWSAADLWEHRRTAESRSVDRYGGTYPGGHLPAPPFGRQPQDPATVVDLRIPDLGRLRTQDPTLVSVVEDRRSVRSFAPDRPPTLDQVAELLFRTCRVRRSFHDGTGYEVVDRPYPSGGSIHETEVYVAAHMVAGLTAGLWRYAADRHQLDQVTDAEHPDFTRLVADAQTTGTLTEPAPVTLVLATRFDRLMYKYETLAYALALKNVGALMQTVYLNATAMGLGVCALGGGSTSTLSRATGIDPLDEGTTGLMVLGVPG